MKKEEFLKELRKKLNGLPKADIEDHVSFYSEMIDDRVDDGKTEDEAIREIGDVDDVVKQILAETPLSRIVKERMRPKRSLRAWEVIFLILGFPLWFPLFLVVLLLFFLALGIIWLLALIMYVVFGSLVFTSIAGFIAFFASMVDGPANLIPLGMALASIGGAIIMFFVAIIFTKIAAKATKGFLRWVKSWFVGKERK